MGSRPTLGAVNSQAEKTNTSHPFLVIVTLFVLRVRYSEKMRSFIPLLLVLALDVARGIKINPCCPEGEIYSLLGSEEEPRVRASLSFYKCLTLLPSFSLAANLT